MPDAEKDRLHGNPLRIVHHKSRNPSRTQLHARHLCAKAHRSAHADNGTAQIFHHIPQNIRPDVRLLQTADFLRCARRDKRLDDLVHTRVIAACRQFPVRKRSRTALTKLHIRCGIEHARLPKPRDIGRTAIHILPAFEHERTEPRTRERPCGKDPRRAEPHNHGTMCRNCTHTGDLHRYGHRCRHHIRIPAQASEHCTLMVKCDIQRIDPRNRRPLPAPRIQCLMNNNHPAHSAG